jgi:uncharacterized membrane protein YdbT with pleckstrin-like domain
VAFPDKLLNEGEDIALDLRPHWWYLAEPTAALVGAIVLGIVVIVQDWQGTAADVLEWALAALVVACLVWFGLRYLRWITTSFVVTTDRLIYRVGVIAKHGIEIPLERINTVFFNQTIFERMLGAGDLSIESGGETGKQTFSDIRKPSAVQSEIYRQMEANNTRMYGGVTRSDAKGTATPEHSIPEQLDQLDALRKRGVISEEEFRAKKAQLLDRM